ncbi:MAG: hypothetical protein HYR85_17540 [Planctomycetes bacterium]|nr:hypothetical protein [Planctomycetota bacterium]MBI3845257.1 hypothetical protein [Planctomycetota bacterium]
MRGIQPTTGEEAWRYTPRRGSHVLDLAYAAAQREFIGVEWSFEKGGDKRLIAFDSETGQCTLRTEMTNPTETAFCRNGGIVITSGGDLIAVASGTTTGRLPFENS